MPSYYRMILIVSLGLYAFVCTSVNASWVLDELFKDEAANNARFTTPFKSKLNESCEPTIFKNLSKFHHLSQLVLDGKIKNKESLQAELKSIRKDFDRKMSTADAKDIDKSCITKGQKAELLECSDDKKRCMCYQAGLWEALQLKEEHGACVSPNEAWCIHWGNDLNMKLTECAGGGKCSHAKQKLPFLCAELDMGVCENGKGPVANMKLEEQSVCPRAKGTSGSTSSVILIMLTQACTWFLAASFFRPA